MSIKKNIFAPWSKGLGAMRRAAALLLVMMLTTVTAWATDKTLSGSESYTAQNGDVLTGSTSGTVTIDNNASITLSDATITGGIVCEGSATITLVGTNSVNVSTASLVYSKAGIQIGGSGTTLTIRGNGSLTATGGSAAAGIGLGRTWDASVTAGSIVIEGGTVTASGDIGIGIGTVGNSQTAAIDGISIKGGTVNASLGKGYLYYGVTATVGYIKVYDTIDMVDASKITETVTYMHGDDDVTANKTDYFTIGESGERRIITPKDDTDYTITIADGIEHGTLEGAATAKYMENVTITATPALGYRFSRLVVKDAQNNDVESTGNSFFMPKGNVTVSAEFAIGSHGTTEFAWIYDTGGGPGNEVSETIYDGVTTVNIQQTGQNFYTGTSYTIQKYEEYTNYRFLLDNNENEQAIPFTGTGKFVQGNNPTAFYVTDNNELGFYDITMTDVGNGKWSVSILKTVPQMDVIPDQTYTGSAITPEPLVIAGSLTLTKGTDYVYSYEYNTNVGTATVRATFQGTYASLGYVEKTFNIVPSTIMVSVAGSGTVTIGDKNASDGEAFGVMSEKGANVTLTLTPESGNTVRSVAYGYTNSEGTNMSGRKLPISDGTATLTVPNDLKDGTGVTLTVTFAAALVGGADEASAVALTDATVTDLAGGWYKVESDITFDHTLNLLGDTHLTIADGATMTVNTATGKGIDSDYTLNVGGAGALSVTASGSNKIAIRVGNYVQTGATVTASGFIGIRCQDGFTDFNIDNDFTFSGGQLTATGTSNGIWADNDITISCTNASDFIQASSYSVSGGTVKVADGKALTDGTEASNGMNGYSGMLTNEQRTAIGGKTLRRAVITSYVDASGTLHENVIAIPLDNTMTTLAAGWYVVNENVDYTGTITLGGNVNLILGDDCTMSFGKGEQLNATIMECQNHNLTIYGQSGGTGWLKAYSAQYNGIKNVYYTQYSGNVLIFDGNGACIDAREFTILGGTLDVESGGGADGEIVTTGDINIRGGKLWARCKGLKTMSGMIILDYTNATDEIYAYSYQPQNELQIADGKTLVDDYGVIWSGVLYNNQIEHGINRRTLRPLVYTGVTLTKEYNNVSATFDGSSETTVSIPVNVNVTSVTYNRTFTEGRPSTVMLPFSLGEGQTLTGGTLYKFTGVTKNETAGKWEATMTETATLQANTPYLLMPNNELVDGKVTFNLGSSWSTVTLNTTGGGTKVTEYEGFELRGTYTEKVWEKNDPEIGKAYVYNANGELVPVAAGTRIRPTECYIIQTKKLMTGTDITVTIPSVEWTGSEIAFDETAVVVKDGETTLTLTTDYTVTAPTGTLQDTGDYPVTITGAGEYAGEVVAMFTIKGKPVTVKNDKNEDVPAATGDAEITQDQDGLTLTLTTPTESTTPHTVNVPQPVEVDHVTIDRTFEDGKACTLYLPFSIAADKIAGGTFNTFTGVDTSNPSEWIVQYSLVAGDIEANTPYIFLPNGTNGGKITVNNGENKVTICTANQHTTENGQWDFIGTYERIKWTHNTADPEWTQQREDEIGSIYGFAAEEKSGATVGQFVQVTDNVWINPMRAYLKHTVVAPARSMDGDAATTELPSSMKVVIVAETTGIEPLSISPEGESTWYSIDGRKLQGKPTAKGMYIHNGRKEVVK